MAVEGTEKPPEVIDWNVENEIHLFSAMLGLKPVGINKHFDMAAIWEEFTGLIGKEVDSALIWDHLSSMYDLNALDENEAITFPIEESFQLPDAEFLELKCKVKIEPPTEPEIIPEKVCKDTIKNKEKKDLKEKKPEIEIKKERKSSSRKNSESSDTPVPKEKKEIKKDEIVKVEPAAKNTPIKRSRNSWKQKELKLESEVSPLPNLTAAVTIKKLEDMLDPNLKQRGTRALRSRGEDDTSNKSISPAATPPPTKRARRI